MNTNLKHPQLDPTVNRTRIKPGTPALPKRRPHFIDQPIADPEDPYRNVHLGWFSDVIEDEKGQERRYAFYIPTTMKTSGNMMIVALPGGSRAEDFFKQGKWKETLEHHCMTAYFVEAAEGWNHKEPGIEIDVLVKVLAEMKSMEYFPCNAPAVYCLGFDDGALIAAMFAVIHQSYLAAFAAWGDTTAENAFLTQFGESPSDCDRSVKRKEVPLPAFIIGQETNVTNYFKRAIRAGEEYLVNCYGRVYREVPKPGSSFVNEEVCCEVWAGDEERIRLLAYADVIEKMVDFAEGFQRWAGEGNGHIRRTKLADRDLHMKKSTETIDGFKRFWWTFEPTAYQKKALEKYPLIIAIHGFSCSGEFFAQNSGWYRVGEERRAVVVFPTAYPFKGELNRNRPINGGITTPRWNTGGFGNEPDPSGPDDVAFIIQMVEITLRNYPEIDQERIYVTGHSNGSMMTQLLMRKIPLRFAGFAPVGAMEGSHGDTLAPTDGIRRNVWYTMGEFDISSCSLESENGNTRTLRMICKANGLDYTSAKYYESGIYMNTIIRDNNKVPLVRFTGVKNWPHTYTPELAFMIYDEFFSRFVRHRDGSLEYLA